VIAVGVGVDERADRRLPGDACHRLEHVGSEPEVEQRVDEHRDTVSDDQSGIAPTPPAVRLDVGEATVADIVQAERVRPSVSGTFTHASSLAPNRQSVSLGGRLPGLA